MVVELKGLEGLERQILDTIVDSNFNVRRRYRGCLDPYSFSERSWPASQTGLLARISADYHDCWIDFNKLEEMVSKDVPMMPNESYMDNIRLLKKVVALIGTGSYSSEWKSEESQQQIKDKIEESTEITVLMNRILAEFSEKHIVKAFYDVIRRKTDPVKNDHYTIMDLGCGAFATTVVSHLSKLHDLSERGLIPKNYNNHLNVVLIDVDNKATYRAQQMLTEPHLHGNKFKPPKLVRTVNLNFADLDRNTILREYEGSVDTILAGASLCHVTDTQPLFHFLNYLSSDRGAVFIWDWLAKTFAANYLRFPTLSRDGEKFIFEFIPKGFSKMERLMVDDTSNLPRDLHIQLKDSKWRSVYEMSHADVYAHHSNMYAWLGYWGFIHNDRESGEIMQSRVDTIPIWRYYLMLFDELASTNRGFSPIKDFLIGTIENKGVQPLVESKVKYNFIESYGPEYEDKMREARLASIGLGFDELSSSYRSMFGNTERLDLLLRNLTPTQKEIRHAMRISVGCRNKDYFDELFSPLGKGK